MHTLEIIYSIYVAFKLDLGKFAVEIFKLPSILDSALILFHK